MNSGFYEPGGCYLGANASIGISPTNFEADQPTNTYFVFPTSERSFQAIDVDIEEGATYCYGISYDGDAGAFSTELVEITIPAAEGPISISPPWPDPFRENSSSTCFVPAQRQYDISVYDVSGRLIKSVQSGRSSGKRFTVTWDGTNNEGNRVSAGCYFFRLYVRGYGSVTEKAFLLK